MQKPNKKGQLSQLPQYGIIFIVVAITFVLGISLISSFGASQAAGSIGQNITNLTQDGIYQMAKQFPNLGMILIFAIIIAVLVGGFMLYKKTR